MPWFHVIMNSPLLFALLAMVVISAIGESEENASARPIILDEIEASIETRKSLVRYYKWSDFVYESEEEAKFWEGIPDWSGTTKGVPIANRPPVKEEPKPRGGFFSLFKRRSPAPPPVPVETRQVKAGAFDIPEFRRDENGTALLDENASGYTGFAKYKFFAFRTLYEVKDGWIERMKTWYPDGKQKEDYNFRKGQKHGPFQHWYDNGQIEKFGNNRDGISDGPFSMWYENGQKWVEQNYKNGKRDGYSIFYNEDGEERKRTAHRNGKFILLEDWEGTGIEEKEAFKIVQKDGASLRYLRYGIFPYSGTMKILDDKGSLVKKEIYLEGKPYAK